MNRSAEVGYFIPDDVIPLSLARHDVDQPTIFSVLINLGRNECYYQFLLSMLGYLEEDHGCQEGFVFDLLHPLVAVSIADLAQWMDS